MFGVLGVWLLLDPTQLEGWVGIVASSPAAKTELRSLYGGLEIGLGLFLLLGCFRPQLTSATCLCLAMAMMSIALARIVGLVLDDSVSGVLLAYLASEVVFGILGVVGLVRSRRASEAT